MSNIAEQTANGRLLLPLFDAFYFSSYCVVPENIHTSSTEGIFSKIPHPSGNSS